jgi:NADH:ubiquinone oxidoreductase subunit F (NADH-binding)
LGSSRRLLAGPPPAGGVESLADHRLRLGDPAAGLRGPALIAAIEAAGLLGRGGAGFPVAAKWRGLAESPKPPVVLVNGAEGEPLSGKDRALMRLRPHLVLDGAALAAEALDAVEIVVYVGEEHTMARETIERAIAERLVAGDALGRRIRLVAAPQGYVSGEASAAVNLVNSGTALPTTSPPRPSEVGIAGRPTLVQNVESLAYAALISRFGPQWYREAGRGESRGTALVTVGGRVARSGVREIELGTTVGELAGRAGAERDDTRAVLVGGYFGTWIDASEAWSLPLDPIAMRQAGLAFGCGLVWFLPRDTCPVAATARIMAFMTGSSAGQCGPCVFGLAAIADALNRLAGGDGSPENLGHLERWAGLVRGRGACRHPDGAVELLASALRTFDDELRAHARGTVCGRGSSCRAA